VTEGGSLLIEVEGEYVEDYLGHLWAGHVTKEGSLLIEVEREGVENAVGSIKVETPSTHCR
jgi:hypothetical protein